MDDFDSQKTPDNNWIFCVYSTPEQTSLPHSIAAKVQIFWFDQWNHAMRKQEDKMVQVSLPANNHSKVHTSRTIPVSPTAPEHFSIEQINKLESKFLHQKWPDKTRVVVIAMESNLLTRDVEVKTIILP